MVGRVTVTVFALCLTLEAARAASIFNVGQTSDSAEKEASLDREKRDTFDMMGFLQHYGYLEKTRGRNRGFVYHSEATITQAIKDFQEFTGLPVTGHLDQTTVNKMRSPRCGFPDMPHGPRNASSGRLSAPQNFFTLGTRWGKDTVTWKPSRLSRKMPEGDQWRALERGLKHWSDVTPLKFRPTTGDADIDIVFARGDHGDGYHNRFDGAGGVLAHAFQPGPGMGGNTHFDEDENWSLGTGHGSDLEIVAAHEFGHALGLGHSNVHGALMAPYYSYSPDLKLHSDDIKGIQALYGSRRTTTTTTTTTSTTPSTTTTTMTTTTPTPTTTTPTPTTTTPTPTTPTTTTTTNGPSLPSYCGPDFRVDAIAGGEQGVSYLFRFDKVYKVGSWGLEPGYPKYITEVFERAPRRHISAAVYLPSTRTHYLFKGTRVWRYTDFQLDASYPRTWMSYQDYFRFRPSAALTFTYGASITKIFMFGDGSFWEWDPRTEKVVPGYPLQTSVYWIGAPQHPEAATSNTDNNFYFFKGNKYFKLHNRVSAGEPKPLGKNWFGYACGAFYIQNDGPTKVDNQRGDLADMKAKDAADELFGTSDVLLKDIPQEKVAPLPFEFDLGVAASGHRNERYYDNY